MNIINEIFAIIIETKEGNESLIRSSTTNSLEEINEVMSKEDFKEMAQFYKEKAGGKLRIFRFYFREEIELD